MTHIAPTMPDLRTGDVIACWGLDPVSLIISGMTASPLPPWRFAWSPSHVAMVMEDERGPWWFESTLMVEGKAGAQWHNPAQRWDAYRGRCLVLRPTVEIDLDQRERMAGELNKFVAARVEYDLGGAILSGTRFLRWLVPASNSRLFCSEMVARVLQVGQLMNWGSPAGYSPGRLCRELVKSGAFEVLP